MKKQRVSKNVNPYVAQREAALCWLLISKTIFPRDLRNLIGQKILNVSSFVWDNEIYSYTKDVNRWPPVRWQTGSNNLSFAGCVDCERPACWMKFECRFKMTVKDMGPDFHACRYCYRWMSKNDLNMSVCNGCWSDNFSLWPYEIFPIRTQKCNPQDMPCVKIGCYVIYPSSDY